MEEMAVCMAVVAPTDLVACLKIPMMGKRYVGFKASSMLPMQKRTTRRKMKAIKPSITMVWIRMRGITTAGFRTSSLIWIAPSQPANYNMLGISQPDGPLVEDKGIHSPRKQ
jgi:hypothetical protein